MKRSQLGDLKAFRDFRVERRDLARTRLELGALLKTFSMLSAVLDAA
ncbi:hypothetical protein ACP70R_045066 [Stipagrostis hirtigluma subsp. patula]